MSSSFKSIDTMFNNLSPEQKLQTLTAELASMVNALSAYPENETILNRIIELNCKCGEYNLQKKELGAAANYFEQADRLAPEGHYLKSTISSKKLSILEDQVLAASSRSGAGKTV